MEQEQTQSEPLVRRRRGPLHRVFRERLLAPQSLAAALPLSIGQLTSASIAVGLVGGFVEVVSRLVRARIDPRVTPYEAALNWHWPWMTPIAWTLVLGVVGALLGLAARWIPGIVRWILPRVWLAFMAFGVALTLPGVGMESKLLLAAGIGSAFGSFVKYQTRLMTILTRRLLPIAIAGEIGLTALVGGAIMTGETRAHAQLHAARQGAPNVLFIVLDTVRAQNLSLHGYERDTTPNLKRLAQRGVWFLNARSPAPWTLPSHASMFTGRWPHELSAGPALPLDDSNPTLAERLSARGYMTAAFSANTHYANAAFGLARGFARFEDHHDNQSITPLQIAHSSLLGSALLEGVSLAGVKGLRLKTKPIFAADVNSRTLAWLDRTRATGQHHPFFVFLNYMDAHGPYGLPRGVTAKYPGEGAPVTALRDQVREYRKTQPDVIARGGKPGGLYRRDDDPEAIRATIDRIARQSVDSYDSCLSYLDAQLGELMRGLEERGVLENTLVIITSDHGEHFGEHGQFGHGTTVHRELTHVPLVMFGPGVPKLGKLTSVVSTRQLPATICELIEDPGHTFAGPMLGDAWRGSSNNSVVLSEVGHLRHVAPSPFFPSSLGAMFSLTNQHHTYIVDGKGRERLFDLHADPREAKDLAKAAQATDALNTMRDQLRTTLRGQITVDYEPAANRIIHTR